MSERITLKQAEQIISEASKHIDLENITFNDPAVFAYFQDGRTDGICMCESDSCRYDLQQIKPSNMEELTAAMALTFGFRHTGQIYWYVKKKYVPQLTYPLLPLPPEIDEILAPTRGLILYREQEDAVKAFLDTAENAVKSKYERGLNVFRKMIEEDVPPTVKRIFHERRAVLCYLMAYLKEYYPELLIKK